MKKIVLASIVIGMYLCGSVTPQDETLQLRGLKLQTVCPVTGEPVNRDIFTDYRGFRIYFCSGACLKTFLEHPDTYMSALENEGIVLESLEPATE